MTNIIKYTTVSLLVLFVVGIMIPNAFAETVPAWVKTNAGWWADGQIDDNTFISGIEWLVSNDIIEVPPTTVSGTTETIIPSWVKNTAGWWADGQIDDSSFVSSIQWLISNNIIIIEKKVIVTDPDFRVAFIGDQGFNQHAIAVLNLIKDEGVHMVLHQGDLDYKDNPDAWDSMISDTLGDDFPYFVSVGDHDNLKWDEYQQKSYDRLKKNPDVKCIGDLGVKSICTYKGLFFIQVRPDIKDSSHSSFIENQLNNNDHIWRICSWSKNMVDMQLGHKLSVVGWEVYENCKLGGAIIATAHEHSYHRTKTLIDIENQIVDSEWSAPNKLKVDEGSTFVFVSGLGGHSVRDQERCLPVSYPYGCNHEWANIYTTDQGATFGALFCTFNVDGQPNKAYCYFKNIDGKIIDAFTITSFLGINSDNTNLIDINMSGMDLTGDDFSNTVISNTNLSNTILVGADLSNVVLVETTLTGSDLTDANLTGITVIGNDLTDTILVGADLTDASLVGVDLTGIDLTDTILRGVSFTDVNLFGVDLTGMDLTGAILRGVDLTGIDLTDTILRGADLSNSIFTDVSLSGKDLTGAILRGVDLTGIDLTDTILVGADLTDANLAGQDISDHDLTDVILVGADLSNSLLPDNGLSGKNLARTIFNMVDLSGMDLSDTNFDCVSGFSYYYLEFVSANCINFVDTNLENVDLTSSYFVNLDLTKIKNKSLAGANLKYAALARSNLSGLDLDNVTLHGTNFSGANLSGVDFRVTMKHEEQPRIIGVMFGGANLSNANFEGMAIGFEGTVFKALFPGEGNLGLSLKELKPKLFGNSRVLLQDSIVSGNDLIVTYIYYNDLRTANLENANLKNTILKFQNLYGVNLTNANLSGADITSVILENANLTNANLTNANLDGADLKNAILVDAILSNTNLGCINHPICSNE